VTYAIQKRTIGEFLNEGAKFFSTIDDGIDFLRGAVGTFPDRLPDLMACANYVRFTQNCRRGAMRVGDVIDGSHIPLISPYTYEKETLTDHLNRHAKRPLVIIASSYT